MLGWILALSTESPGKMVVWLKLGGGRDQEARRQVGALDLRSLRQRA